MSKFRFKHGLNILSKNPKNSYKRKESHFCNSLFISGATSNRKSVYIALFLNKLYLYYDVSPLNKVFTTLHRSTQVCVLGSISACKGRYLFGIINISKNFFFVFTTKSLFEFCSAFF